MDYLSAVDEILRLWCGLHFADSGLLEFIRVGIDVYSGASEH